MKRIRVHVIVWVSSRDRADLAPVVETSALGSHGLPGRCAIRSRFRLSTLSNRLSFIPSSDVSWLPRPDMMLMSRWISLSSIRRHSPRNGISRKFGR